MANLVKTNCDNSGSQMHQQNDDNLKWLCGYINYEHPSYDSYTLWLNHEPRRLELNIDFRNKKAINFYSSTGLPSEFVMDYDGKMYDIFVKNHIRCVDMFSIDIDYNHYDMVKVFFNVRSVDSNGTEIKTPFETILATEEVLKKRGFW